MKLHHFNPKKQKRGLLYQVFVLVALIQISLLVALGGYIVSHHIIEEQKFEAPPTVEKVEHAQKEHRVRVERQQKKSRKMTKRISIANPQNINAPQINITVPAAISVGGGISTISEKGMTEGMKIALPTVDIGGIKSKTEKVLICLDAGPYLMTDERGGLDTYKVIREDIKSLVNKLPSTVLFNLMAFDISSGVRIDIFQSNLVAATAFNKKIACNWIDPINASLTSIGTKRSNYRLKYPFLPQPPQTSSYNPNISFIYHVYQAALEQGADTIYILTTSWVDPDRIKMPWSDAEIDRYRRALEKNSEQRKNALKRAGWTEDKQLEYEMERARADVASLKKGRDWILSENAKRKAKGVPLYTGTTSQAVRENKFFEVPKERPPAVKGLKPVQAPRLKSYGRAGIFKYYNTLFKEVYFDKKMKPPVVHMIVFRGKNEEWTQAENKVVRQFTNANMNGRSRVLKGLKAVKEYE